MPRRRQLMAQPKLMLGSLPEERASGGGDAASAASGGARGLAHDLFAERHRAPLSAAPPTENLGPLALSFALVFVGFSYLPEAYFSAFSVRVLFLTSVGVGICLKVLLRHRRHVQHRKKLEEEENQHEVVELDWSKKIRVFVGDVGLEAFAKGGASGDAERDAPSGSGYLAQLDSSGTFRDALIM
jgi:hypothetical protein